MPPPPCWGSGLRARAPLVSVATALLFAGLFAILPRLLHIRYDRLLWSEGFTSQAIARSFVTGLPERVIEAPKPLWNLPWLITAEPHHLFVLVVLLFGAATLLLLHLSRHLADSLVPGIAAALFLALGTKDLLGLYLGGNWTVPNIALGLLLVLALERQHWRTAAAAALGLGLVRPENWILALLLPVFVATRRARLTWLHFLPLCAPLLWLLWDLRAAGDPLYSYRISSAYALLSGIDTTGFAGFWPRFRLELHDVAGLTLLAYAGTGLLFRLVNLIRATRTPGRRAVLLDPLLAVIFLPVLFSWLSALRADIVVMCRFFYLSVAALVMLATLLPFELRRLSGNRLPHWVAVLLLIPLLAVGARRTPEIIRTLQLNLADAETKVLAVEGLAAAIRADSLSGDSLTSVMIPCRRYGQFRAQLPEPFRSRLISYREVSLAAASTQEIQTQGTIMVPDDSPESVRDLMLGGYRLSSFMPALALWVPADEIRFLRAFAFDEEQYADRDYVAGDDEAGFVAFTRRDPPGFGAGLIYEIREVTPEQAQQLVAPDQTLP